jgi:hypothetical protein
MRLRYRAQTLADIDAIHRFLEEHSVGKANGSRECAPDDRLREAIQNAAKAGLLRRKSSSQ